MVTCLKCGRVYLAESYDEVKGWADFFKNLCTQEQWLAHGTPVPSIENYMKCRCGASYKDFRSYEKGDAPNQKYVNLILENRT